MIFNDQGMIALHHTQMTNASSGKPRHNNHTIAFSPAIILINNAAKPQIKPNNATP